MVAFSCLQKADVYEYIFPPQNSFLLSLYLKANPPCAVFSEDFFKHDFNNVSDNVLKIKNTSLENVFFSPDSFKAAVVKTPEET